MIKPITDLTPNEYLKVDTLGYYSLDYIRMGYPNNPDFLCYLKNQQQEISNFVLNESYSRLYKILEEDLPRVISKVNFNIPVIVTVPRAKAEREYDDSQLLFRAAVEDFVSSRLDYINGVHCIKRIVDTKTTHLARTNRDKTLNRSGTLKNNDGSMPYPHITLETCIIDKNLINGKEVVLIDDIYTNTANIDEDCIQALYDCGAKNVVFYAVACTQKKY